MLKFSHFFLFFLWLLAFGEKNTLIFPIERIDSYFIKHCLWDVDSQGAERVYLDIYNLLWQLRNYGLRKDIFLALLFLSYFNKWSVSLKYSLKISWEMNSLGIVVNNDLIFDRNYLTQEVKWFHFRKVKNFRSGKLLTIEILYSVLCSVNIMS